MPYSTIELFAAMAAGVTTAIVLNPLDVLKTQIQVKRQSVRQTVRNLYKSEGFPALFKGVTARMFRASVICLSLIFAHMVKKLSIKEDYQNNLLW